MSKILFLNFLHWVYPKANNPLKDYLTSQGVECKYIQPCEIGHCNRALINANIPERKPVNFYRGFNLDNFIRVETTMESGWYNPKVSTLIKYRKWAMYLIDWAFDTFEKEKPDYILIEGGLTYLSRTMSEVAREMGIKIISIENSFIKDKIFIDFHTGAICNRHFFARTSNDWIKARYLTKTQEKEANKIIHNTFKNLKFQTIGEFDKSFLKYSKTVFVPLQVYADQVTVYDSQFNNEQFLNNILELAYGTFSGWNFILKCHPKEERNKPKATGDWLQSKQLPPNVTVLRGEVNSINTQSLIKMADIIMVNNSQAGLEACLLEKPVVVFGDAFYARKGFTCDYNENFDWDYVKYHYTEIPQIKTMKLWFLYFYKWLYNRILTDEDKQRISKELNLKEIK